MLLSPLKRTFDVLNIQLIPLANQQLLFDKLFYWFIWARSLFKSIQTVILIKISWLTKKQVYLTKGCRCSRHLINMGYKNFLSFSSIRTTPCSLPTNEDTIQRLLNLGFNIKETILWAFLLSYFLKNEKKESNTLITSLLTLQASKDNSSRTTESSFIKIFKWRNNLIFFL